jgi:hypothetical protein
MGLSHCDFILESDGCSRLQQQGFGVSLSESTLGAQINHLGDLVHTLGVDDWESVNWNQDFVAFTVDPNRVVIVLVCSEGLIVILCGGRELHINVLAHTCGHHTFLLVTDFKERGLWRQNVQPLGGW